MKYLPNGILYEWQSISFEIPGNVWPSCKNVKLQQCSTTCKPLNTSPSASTSVLPCSVVIFLANAFCKI